MADDLSLSKLGAGVVGAAVSLRFVQGSIAERFSMWLGGAALSYYATSPVVAWAKIDNAEGFTGFLIGLFGMAIVAKIYEVIVLLDAKQISLDIWSWAKKKWSA